MGTSFRKLDRIYIKPAKEVVSIPFFSWLHGLLPFWRLSSGPPLLLLALDNSSPSQSPKSRTESRTEARRPQFGQFLWATRKGQRAARWSTLRPSPVAISTTWGSVVAMWGHRPRAARARGWAAGDREGLGGARGSMSPGLRVGPEL